MVKCKGPNVNPSIEPRIMKYSHLEYNYESKPNRFYL